MREKLFAEHTMGKSLEQYVGIKMPQCLNDKSLQHIVVRGCYKRREEQIFSSEKSDKLFNWKRPTYEPDAKGKLFCNCFPGTDYVEHYALLIQAYSDMYGLELEVQTESPGQENVLTALIEETNILKIPKADIVILGIVHHFFTSEEFEGDGDFMWKQETVDGRTILYLGCKFSIWGDIAGEVLRVLAAANEVKGFIYVGKLGTLGDEVPNEYLVTGDYSYVDGIAVVWDNLFLDVIGENVINGRHVTLPSVMQETKSWLNANIDKFSFVDPEIGKLAKAANEMGVDFSYLHIVSDNLKREFPEDLSNERQKLVIEKRSALLEQVRTILVTKRLM